MNSIQKNYLDIIDDMKVEIKNNGYLNSDYDELIPNCSEELRDFEIAYDNAKLGYIHNVFSQFHTILNTIEKLCKKYDDFGMSDEYIELIDYYIDDFYEVMTETIKGEY